MNDMKHHKETLRNGLYGLLVGDALGVPYEFHKAEEIPPEEQIDMTPPAGFDRTYPGVPPGTWSDDGAQALCLLDSLVTCGNLNLHDLGQRMVSWVDEGFWTADGVVFDCGIQTMASLRAFAAKVPPEQSGMVKPDGKGNGALMRVLPLALWRQGSDEELAKDAHRQALVTHGHVCNQVCCALYCLWARNLMKGLPPDEGYEKASCWLRSWYEGEGMLDYLHELEMCVAEGTPTGGGYVVDSIRTAKHLLFSCNTYIDVVRGAVAFGNDTDTTAAIAGGLAGIAFGEIPQRWMEQLRGKEKVEELLIQWLG